MKSFDKESLMKEAESLLRIQDETQRRLEGILQRLQEFTSTKPKAYGGDDAFWADFSLPYIQCALNHASTSSQYLDNVVSRFYESESVRRARSSSGQELPTRTPTAPSVRPLFFAEGTAVTSALIDSKISSPVDVQCDPSLKTVVSTVKGGLTRAIGCQALLLPLLTGDGCSVFVEDGEANSMNRSTKSMGFTTAALMALATKAIVASPTARKAVFITHPSKSLVVDSIFHPDGQFEIQVVNLLRPQQSASRPNESCSRLIVCSMAHVDAGMINTEDVDHMIVDGCGPQTATLFDRFPFRKLRDVVYRGPMSAVKKLPCPKASLFRARVWRFERSVNMFDVHTFSLARQLESLLSALPQGRNYLVTSDLNSYFKGIITIPTIDLLPEDCDHLIVTEIPSQLEELKAMLKKSCAKIVTVLCQPHQRSLLTQAMTEEQLLRGPSVRILLGGSEEMGQENAGRGLSAFSFNGHSSSPSVQRY